MSRLARGSLVKFRIRDIFYPEVTEVLRRVTPEMDVSGRLLFFSDAGREQARYAVIEVQGIAVPVIVSVERCRAATAPGEERMQEEVAAAAPPKEE